MKSRRKREQSSLTKLSKLAIACWVRALRYHDETPYSFFFTRTPIAKSTIMGAKISTGIGHSTESISFLIFSPSRRQPICGFRLFHKRHPLPDAVVADHIHSIDHTKSVICVTDRCEQMECRGQYPSQTCAASFRLIAEIWQAPEGDGLLGGCGNCH